MGVLKVIATILLIRVELSLIAVVLLQSGRSAGLSGSIAGGAETFFGKNKARSLEGRLETWTKISAAGFIILSVLLSILK